MLTSPFSSKEIHAIRSNFAHINEGHVYLNHAAISPLPKSTKKAIDHFLYERSADPVENFETCMETAAETRRQIASYIHAPFEDQITFIVNTSEGISAVAEGLQWQKGDQVILNTMEFPANVQPFRFLEQKGVEIIYIQPENGSLTPEMFEAAITPKTKLLSISAVQFLSGFRADLKSIGELCKNRNIFFVVDGIQALGGFPIDVVECRIDALATGGHKWLMSPMGIGFLYLSENIAANMNPVKTGWLSVKDPWELFNYNQNWLPVSQHLETGTLNFMGIMGLNASLNMFREWGEDRVASQIHYLCNHLTDELSKQKSVSLITQPQKELRAGIVSCTISGDADAITAGLKTKYKVTIAAREGHIRFSPHFYNTPAEIDQALEHLITQLK